MPATMTAAGRMTRGLTRPERAEARRLLGGGWTLHAVAGHLGVPAWAVRQATWTPDRLSPEATRPEAAPLEADPEPEPDPAWIEEIEGRAAIVRAAKAAKAARVGDPRLTPGELDAVLEPIDSYWTRRRLARRARAARPHQGGAPMLVLSRKIDERILIGSDIVITVVAIRGDKVRLGVTADPSVAVDREEIRRLKDGGPERGGAA